LFQSVGRRVTNRQDTGILWATRARAARAWILADAGDLEQDGAGLDDGGPVFDLALALAHAGLGRDRGDALVGEDADVELAAPLDRLAGDDAAGLDGLGADAARLQRLQAVIAEGDVVAAGGVTSYAAFLAFSVLDPLGHHGHRWSPPSSR
jgi:hypothetical protein